MLVKIIYINKHYFVNYKKRLVQRRGLGGVLRTLNLLSFVIKVGFGNKYCMKNSKYILIQLERKENA